MLFRGFGWSSLGLGYGGCGWWLEGGVGMFVGLWV